MSSEESDKELSGLYIEHIEEELSYLSDQNVDENSIDKKQKKFEIDLSILIQLRKSDEFPHMSKTAPK